MRLSRNVLAVLSFLIAANCFAAADIFILIPGVNGDSIVKGREGWSNVDGHTLTILPAVQDEKKKTFSSQCSAAVSTLFGAGAPAVVQLTGQLINGDVLIEAQRPETGVTFYRAALQGATINRLVSAQAADIFRNDVVISFNKIILTVWQQKSDGTPGQPQVGTFDCTKP